MECTNIIGIVGGMGPYASLDLLHKILDQTKVSGDHDHIPIVMISVPNEIVDRTDFLLGRININPAHAIVEMILKLVSIGANIIGIPCNTVHAPRIFNVIEEVNRKNKEIKIVNMIDEVAEFIEYHYPALKKIGILCTTGTSISKIYPTALEIRGFHVIMPDENFQESIHKAIYNRKFGIKALSNPVTEIAKYNVINAINHLREKGANALVLGCSEIALALKNQNIEGMPIIDPVLILARALIREVEPDKLKPMKVSIS